MGMYVAPTKETDERGTPQEFFERLHKEFTFTIDVCASHENAKLPRYWTKADDALSKSWFNERCWMNPPYSQTGIWMEKAFREARNGAFVVCLVPSATDTRWWHDIAVNGEIRFVKGRLKFNGQKFNAPFPSALIIFRSYTAKFPKDWPHA